MGGGRISRSGLRDSTSRPPSACSPLSQLRLLPSSDGTPSPWLPGALARSAHGRCPAPAPPGGCFWSHCTGTSGSSSWKRGACRPAAGARGASRGLGHGVRAQQTLTGAGSWTGSPRDSAPHSTHGEDISSGGIWEGNGPDQQAGGTLPSYAHGATHACRAGRRRRWGPSLTHAHREHCAPGGPGRSSLSPTRRSPGRHVALLPWKRFAAASPLHTSSPSLS